MSKSKEQQKVDALEKELSDISKKISEHEDNIAAFKKRSSEILDGFCGGIPYGELPDAKHALLLSKCPVYNDRYRIKAVDDKTWVELMAKNGDSYFFKKETGMLKNARKANLYEWEKVDINKVMEVWNENIL